MPKIFLKRRLNLGLKTILFFSKKLLIILFFSLPSRSKSVKITYFLFLSSLLSKSSKDFPEISKMSSMPIFLSASLSLFPSTIIDDSLKTSINLSGL